MGTTYHEIEAHILLDACDSSKPKLGQPFRVFGIHVKCYLIAIKNSCILEVILSEEIKLALANTLVLWYIGYLKNFWRL